MASFPYTSNTIRFCSLSNDVNIPLVVLVPAIVCKTSKLVPKRLLRSVLFPLFWTPIIATILYSFSTLVRCVGTAYIAARLQ